MPLILASSSPRRQELLRAAGIEYTVDAADLSEVPHPGEAPQRFAERMAREKALAVGRRHSRPGEWILAADTVVFVNGEILGKPADAPDPAAEAARMLRLLSGCEHRVITGVCLLGSGQWPVGSGQKGMVDSGQWPVGSGQKGMVDSGQWPVGSGQKGRDQGSSRAAREPSTADFIASEITRVWMNEITEEEIRAYVASGEPLDKAGAYAIQGGASRWIPRIEGCYFNVVGLPVPLVYRMLRQRGIL